MKNIHLKKVILNNEGYQYIEGWLKNASTLSQFVLDNTNLHKGEVYTYVPEYLNEKEIYEFDAGVYKISKEDPEIVYKLPNGKIGAVHTLKNIVNVEYWLVENIMEDFESGLSNTCIIEDSVSAGILQYHKINYAKEYKNALFSWIQKGTSREKMFEIINGTPNFSPPLIGFSFLDNNFQLGEYPVLSDEYFSTVSKNVHKVIVGSYDSEGYIIWEKK